MSIRYLLRFGLLVGFIVLVAGCSILPTPTPTATPEPTTTPTSAPTNTPRPSATPTKADTLPPALAFALNKTQNAKSLRYEFESFITQTQNGKDQVIPGLSLNGVDSTLNRQVTISGTTSDTREFITYDVIVLGEDVFLKGLTGVSGVDPKQWYQLPSEIQAGIRRLPTARGLLASFEPQEFARAQFRAAGSETLDEQSCSVWASQNLEFVRNALGVTAESDLKEQLGEIDGGEFKAWTCADGYIHLMQGQVYGHAPNNADAKASVNLRFALADFDQALEIQPPKDSKPFPTQAERATPSTTAAGDTTPTVDTTATSAPSPTEQVTEQTTPTGSPTAATP